MLTRRELQGIARYGRSASGSTMKSGFEGIEGEKNQIRGEISNQNK